MAGELMVQVLFRAYSDFPARDMGGGHMSISAFLRPGGNGNLAMILHKFHQQVKYGKVIVIIVLFGPHPLVVHHHDALQSEICVGMQSHLSETCTSLPFFGPALVARASADRAPTPAGFAMTLVCFQ